MYHFHWATKFCPFDFTVILSVATNYQSVLCQTHHTVTNKQKKNPSTYMINSISACPISNSRQKKKAREILYKAHNLIICKPMKKLLCRINSN
jgi:hypothetical protein